jgi:CHAT domain-containing protein/tetratricopeptide (TPR) repeat protein
MNRNPWTRAAFAGCVFAAAFLAQFETSTVGPARRGARVLRTALPASAAAQDNATKALPDSIPRTLDGARTLLSASKLAEAEALARVLLADADKKYGPQSLQSADVLDVLVETLWRARKVKDGGARDLAERVVSIRESAAPPDSALLARSAYNLGNVLQNMGDYAAARAAYERALRIQESAPSAEADLPRTLTTYGMLLHKTEDFADAKSALERAAGAYEAEGGPDDPRLATVHFNLGKVALAMEDFDAARREYERALELWQRTSGPKSLEVAKALNGRGQVDRVTGEYAGALVHFERGLEIVVELQGPDGLDVGIARTSVGQLLYMMGDYAGARKHLERNIDTAEKNLGPDHPQSLPDVLALATLESTLGNTAAAAPLFDRAARGWEKAFGPEHTWVAAALSGQGQNASLMGDHATAEELSERALAIRTKSLGPDHPEVAKSLESLALVLEGAGDRAGAISAREKALAIRERSMNAGHPEMAQALRNLGSLVARDDELDRAEKLIRRAAAIEESLSGPSNPDFARSLAELARVLNASGRDDEAFDVALRAETIAADHLRATARGMQERDALAYEAVRASGLRVAFDLLVESPSGPRVRRAWDRALRSRALVLDEMASRHRAIGRSENPEVAALAQELDAARRRLANLVVRSDGSLSVESRERLISEARRDKEAAERALAEKSRTFREALASESHGLDDVARALPRANALVAFYRFESSAGDAGSAVAAAGVGTSESRDAYLAFVVNGREAAPLMLPLGNAAAIDSAIAAWNASILAGAQSERTMRALGEAASRRAGDAVAAALWAPLAPLLGGAERVFIVPDGAINMTSFAALPVGEHDYLVERGPTIHYLSNERDIVTAGASKPAGSGLLALGGPDFDDRSFTASLEPIRSELAETMSAALASATGLFRGAAPACRGFTSLTFEPLPGTEREVRAIADIWEESLHLRGGSAASGKVTRLTGARANEEIVKRTSPGKQMLHLATHGFRLDKSCGANVKDQPLLLSGLALAGANHRASVSSDEEDGILTAEEVASLDLSGVEWAVLSGCETAAGAVVSGEGVFGLRRAFEVAGARTLIMSLWPAEDETTRAWMTALYRARLTRGAPTSDAVRDASLTVLRDLREKQAPTLPILWAGFVAAGDWR